MKANVYRSQDMDTPCIRGLECEDDEESVLSALRAAKLIPADFPKTAWTEDIAERHDRSWMIYNDCEVNPSMLFYLEIIEENEEEM